MNHVMKFLFGLPLLLVTPIPVAHADEFLHGYLRSGGYFHAPYGNWAYFDGCNNFATTIVPINYHTERNRYCYYDDYQAGLDPSIFMSRRCTIESGTMVPSALLAFTSSDTIPE